MKGIDKHVQVASDANGRGSFLVVCRCGRRSYGASYDDARGKQREHERSTSRTLLIS